MRLVEPAAPMPLDWHPAYRDKTDLLDWLDGNGPLASYDVIRLPKIPSVRARFVVEGPEPIGPSIGDYTMTKRRCAGPAPYVGRPFVYSWWAGIDEFGRCIAADSTRQYNPADEFRHWGRDPLSVPLI